MNSKINPAERITDLMLLQMLMLSLYCIYCNSQFNNTFLGVIGLLSALSCFPIMIWGLVLEASYAKLYKEDSDTEKNPCPACGQDGFHGFCDNCGYPN